MSGLLDAPVVLDARSTAPYGTKLAAAFQPWRVALAGRAAAPANVLVLGDSTDEGTGISSLAVDRYKSWPDRLAQLLRARFPTVSETQGAVAPNYVPVYTDSSLLTGWTIGSGWSKRYSNGLSATAAFSSTAGSTLTYTIPVGATSLDVLHVAGASLTGWTYTVDGGAASATQGTTGSNRDGATVRVTGWDASATHTLVVTSVGNNCYIDGIMIYSGNETKGIRVFNGGHHGSRADLYLSTGSWAWLNANPAPTVFQGAQSVIAANPDLLVVAWGYNDINNSIPSATFKTNITTLVAQARAMLPSKQISVIYLSKWLPGPTWLGGGAIEPWANYQTALASLAAADPLGAYVSLGKVMPQPGSTLALAATVYSDSGVHAVAKGYSMAADAIASLIAA